LEEWVELPAIGPEHVKAAMRTKHVVTGSLETPVKTFPEFKGREKHFLKTQLVRLLHNCEIVPSEMFRQVDEKRRNR